MDQIYVFTLLWVLVMAVLIVVLALIFKSMSKDKIKPVAEGIAHVMDHLPRPQIKKWWKGDSEKSKNPGEGETEG